MLRHTLRHTWSDINKRPPPNSTKRSSGITISLRYIRYLLRPLAEEISTFVRIDTQTPLGKRKRDSSNRLPTLLQSSKTLELLSDEADAHIHALVNAVACPKAIADLKSISKLIENHRNPNKIQTAMNVFENSEKSIFRNERLKIFAEIYW